DVRSLFFHDSRNHRPLHSFPTRRSSDLLLRNLLHAGGVVVTSPRGTLSLLQSRACASLVEKPRDEHSAPRSTVHPEPSSNGVGVISTTFRVLANRLAGPPNNICGSTSASSPNLLILLLLKEGKHLGDDDRRHQVIRNVGKSALTKPVLQTVCQPVQRRGGEGHEPIGQLTLSLPNKLVDLAENASLSVAHRRRFPLSSGLLAK